MITEHIITALKAESTITGEVGQNIFPGSSPDAPTYPILVVTKITGVEDYDFAGPVDIQRARVQIDVIGQIGAGKGYADVVRIKKLVRNFLTARPPPGPACVIDSVQCINDSDSPAAAPLMATIPAGPRVRRRLLEFTVWYRD